MNSLSLATLVLLWASAVSVGAASAADQPSAVAAPVFKAGDSWVFDQTTEVGQAGFSTERLDVDVERVDGDTVLVGIKNDGAPTDYVDHIMGVDWSRRLVVAGQEVVTNRPFAFPMSVGDSWTADWIDPTRRDQLVSMHAHQNCAAADWEDLSVTAGTFHALKIVCKGVDERTIEVPAQAVSGSAAGAAGVTSISHAQRGGQGKITYVTYSELYYVPKLKNYVKGVDEKYNTDNVRVYQQTSVLVSSNVGK